MADSELHEIFIIKRYASHDCEHHGGAWKIAFADFMTAMMALFLVLWLISSTSDKTKHTVAQYFNPVKLVDMTTLKKGFRDPKETEMGSGPNVKESEEESKSSQHTSTAKDQEDVKCQVNSNAQAQTETALFRDPYAVLTEIAASASMPASKSSSGAASSATSVDSPGAFSDPFTTTPQEQEKTMEGLLPLAQGKDSEDKQSEDKRDKQEKKVQDKDADSTEAAVVRKPQETTDHSVPLPTPASQNNSQVKQGVHSERSPESSSAAAAAKLKSEIESAINNSAHKLDLPHIEVQVTAEGVLISLTDDANYSMFAIGSAEPQPETVQIMEKIGHILKDGSDSIVIRGHTDGRPYRSAIYDNWRLSSARAHMALYMLVRGGLSEKRIESVDGFADHHLKSSNNPNASENRRIEILLRKERP